MVGLFLLFLSGALLCNSVPHLAAGLRGEPFPSLFARPRGIGESSPVVNFLWGSANLATGLAALLGHITASGTVPGLIAIATGWLMLGSYCARHFAKVRARK